MSVVMVADRVYGGRACKSWGCRGQLHQRIQLRCSRLSRWKQERSRRLWDCISNVSKQLNNEKTNIFNVPHNRNACFM